MHNHMHSLGQPGYCTECHVEQWNGQWTCDGHWVRMSSAVTRLEMTPERDAPVHWVAGRTGPLIGAHIAAATCGMANCRAQQECLETCHSITFYFMKRDSKRCSDATTPESIHTKDESKRGSAFAFIFGVN